MDAHLRGEGAQGYVHRSAKGLPEEEANKHLIAERRGGEALIVDPVRGTGRTDFQNGDPEAQYDSLFQKLLKLPDDTLVFPAHDYEGRTSSTIGDERRFNPRLQVDSRQAYVQQMNALSLDPPRLIEVAVPANRRCGV